MAAGSLNSRVVVPTAIAAIVGTGINVAVNVATNWKTNPWAWLAVAALTVISWAVSLWLYRNRQATDSPSASVQEVRRSTVDGDVTQVSGVNGSVRIGPGSAALPGPNFPTPSAVTPPVLSSGQSVADSDVGGSTYQVNQAGGDVEINGDS